MVAEVILPTIRDQATVIRAQMTVDSMQGRQPPSGGDDGFDDGGDNPRLVETMGRMTGATTPAWWRRWWI